MCACAQNDSHKQDGKASSARHTLVVYFSATGTTRAVAQEIARAAHTDVYEIEPQQKYTAADLDWIDGKLLNHPTNSQIAHYVKQQQ